MLIQRRAYTPHTPLSLSVCVSLPVYGCAYYCFCWCCFCCCGCCGGGCCFLQLVIFCPTTYLRIDNLMLYEKKGHRIKNDGSAIIMFFSFRSFIRLFYCHCSFPCVNAYRCVDTHSHQPPFLFFSRFLFLSIGCSFCIGIIAKRTETKYRIELFRKFMHTDYLYFVFRFKINAYRFFDTNEFV